MLFEIDSAQLSDGRKLLQPSQIRFAFSVETCILIFLKAFAESSESVAKFFKKRFKMSGCISTSSSADSLATATFRF